MGWVGGVCHSAGVWLGAAMGGGGGGACSPGRLHEVGEGWAEVWGGVTVVLAPGVRVVPCRCGCRWAVPGLAGVGGGAMLLRGVPCNTALPCNRKVRGWWWSLCWGGAVPGTSLS